MNIIAEKKQQFLLNALLEIPYSGWNEECFKNIGKKYYKNRDYGYLYFYKGISDLAIYFDHYINQQVAILLDNLILPDRLSEKISFIIQARLNILYPYKNSLRRLIGYYLMPNNCAQGLKNLWQITDRIWHSCGDKSVDLNYYSKRATLALVYNTTQRFWLDDYSINQQDTHLFLQRRLNDVHNFGKNKQLLMQKIKSTPFVRLLFT